MRHLAAVLLLCLAGCASSPRPVAAAPPPGLEADLALLALALDPPDGAKGIHAGELRPAVIRILDALGITTGGAYVAPVVPADSIDVLSDVATSGAVAGDVLVLTGGAWVDTTPTLALASDVAAITTQTDGQVLTYDLTDGWRNESLPSGTWAAALLAGAASGTTNPEITAGQAIVGSANELVLGATSPSTAPVNSLSVVLNADGDTLDLAASGQGSVTATLPGALTATSLGATTLSPGGALALGDATTTDSVTVDTAGGITLDSTGTTVLELGATSEQVTITGAANLVTVSAGTGAALAIDAVLGVTVTATGGDVRLEPTGDQVVVDGELQVWDPAEGALDTLSLSCGSATGGRIDSLSEDGPLVLASTGWGEIELDDVGLVGTVAVPGGAFFIDSRDTSPIELRPGGGDGDSVVRTEGEFQAWHHAEAAGDYLALGHDATDAYATPGSGDLTVTVDGANSLRVVDAGGGELLVTPADAAESVAITTIGTSSDLTVTPTGSLALTSADAALALTADTGGVTITDSSETLTISTTGANALTIDAGTGSALTISAALDLILDPTGQVTAPGSGGITTVQLGDGANASAANNTAVGNGAAATGSQCTAVGSSAATAGNQSTAVGFSASAATDSSVAVGRSATTPSGGGNDNTAVGASATTGSGTSEGTVLGTLATLGAAHHGSLALGAYATSTQSREAIFGSTTAWITSFGVVAGADGDSWSITHDGTDTKLATGAGDMTIDPAGDDVTLGAGTRLTSTAANDLLLASAAAQDVVLRAVQVEVTDVAGTGAGAIASIASQVLATRGMTVAYSALTASRWLGIDESGAVFSNAGAGGTVTVSLREPTVSGVVYTFVRVAAFGLRVDPGDVSGGSTWNVEYSGGSMSNGEYLELGSAGARITLVADVANTAWVALEEHGTLTEETP